MISIRHGFTLIELLIVIAILGILAAAVIVAINPTKRTGQTRDAIRKSDLRVMAGVLEEYYIMYGQYPEEVTDGGGVCWWDWESGSIINGENDEFLQILIDQDYMKTVPIEKKPFTDSIHTDTCSYRYVRSGPICASGKTYAILHTNLETDSGEDDIRPTDFNCGWGESDPGTEADKYDWTIFLLE